MQLNRRLTPMDADMDHGNTALFFLIGVYRRASAVNSGF
jgi:hypothetical protein